MGMEFARSVRKAKASWGLFGQGWELRMSMAVVGVDAARFGLCGASGPSAVRARLKGGGKLPQLQGRTTVAVSNCLLQNWENWRESFPPSFSPSVGKVF